MVCPCIGVRNIGGKRGRPLALQQQGVVAAEPLQRVGGGREQQPATVMHATTKTFGGVRWVRKLRKNHGAEEALEIQRVGKFGLEEIRLYG